MSKLLRSRQVFHAGLFRIQLPGMQVKHRCAPLLINFPHAVARVAVGKQAEVPPAAERKATAKHFEHAHRKLVKLIRDFVRTEWRVGYAVVGMKTDGKD